MNAHENPQNRLTLNTPISFDDMIVELCDAHGLADSEKLSRYLWNLDKDAKVIMSIVVPADEEQLGMVHIVNAPSTEGDVERQRGYNFYPLQGNEEIEYITKSTYLGNLTEPEEYALAVLLNNKHHNNKGSDRVRVIELRKIVSYPVTPTERYNRKHAAEDPSAIGKYITLDQPMPFSQAFKQICVLYSIMGEMGDYEAMFFGVKDDEEVQFSLLIPGTGGLANILHLTKTLQDEEKAYGYILYPVYEGMEEYGNDYSLRISVGIVGQLTEQEEKEYAYLYAGGNGGLRFDELYGIRLGNMTHEEAAELKQAQESLDAQGLLWVPRQQTERIQYLWDKSHYGFETIEVWRKWKEDAENAQEKISYDYGKKRIADRNRILAKMSEGDVLDRQAIVLFTRLALVPEDKTLEDIQEMRKRHWMLVDVVNGSEEEEGAYLEKLSNIVGNDEQLQDMNAFTYKGENALFSSASMVFAKGDAALEKIKAMQEQEDEDHPLGQTAVMCNLRIRVLFLFPNLVPTEQTLEYIAEKESQGWRLDSVLLNDDISSLEHEEVLVTEHGKEKVFHSQQSAKRDAQTVGVNLFFIKTG